MLSRGIRNNNPLNVRRSKDKWQGILPDEPLGIPSEKPSRWLMVGAAMAIQKCGWEGLDLFAMLRGWELARG